MGRLRRKSLSFHIFSPLPSDSFESVFGLLSRHHNLTTSYPATLGMMSMVEMLSDPTSGPCRVQNM